MENDLKNTKKKKRIQCCYCKTNSINNPHVSFYNKELGINTIIANGCSNCKNYYENLTE